MDNYNLVKKLGAGPSGGVFLVQHKADGRQFSMKRLQCESKAEADGTLRQAMTLGKLLHPSFGKYKEFFVGSEESEIYVYVVAEFHPCGDLSKLFRKRRKQQKAFGELLVKKWFGQLVEALIFIHERDIVHGALKPTNVFMTENLDVSVGDFGILSSNADLAAGIAWSPPEETSSSSSSSTRPRDDRADVYALGCILLQLVTCHLVDETKMLSMLTRSKSDPRVLEELLQQIMVDPDQDDEDEDEDNDEGDGKYSVELCAMIRSLMRLCHDQRPTAFDLQSYPFVQECFELNRSTLQRASRRCSKDGIYDVEAFEGSLPEVLRFLAASTNSIPQSLSGLKGLRLLFEEEELDSLPAESKTVLGEILRKHGVANVEIACLCCQIALEILTGKSDEVFGSESFIGAVISCIRANVTDANFLVDAARVLTILSVDEETSDLIGQLGGIQEILIGWRCFPHLISLAVVCCSGLSSLAYGPGNSAIVSREKVVSDVLSALRYHGHLATEVAAEEEELDQVLSLVEHACTALLSLSMDPDNVEYMAERSTIDVLMDVLLRYGNVARIVKCATLAMASLIESDPQSATRFCHESGIPIVLVVSAYDNFKRDAEVVESICSLILELTEYRQVCATMLQHPILTMLKEVVQEHGENESLLRLTKHSITKLIGEKDAAVQAKVRSQSAKKARARRQSLSVAQHNHDRRPSREPQL